MASSAALTLRVSWQVSSSRTSAPPSTSAAACWWKLSTSCEKVTPPVTVMALVVGPMEPATNRGLEVVENSSAACRARRAAARFRSVGGVRQPVFGQHQPRAAEGIGFDGIGAGCQVRAMNPQDDIRPGAIEILVAALEGRAAEIARLKGAPVAAWCPWPHRAPGCEFREFPPAPAGAPPGGS